MLRLQLGSAFNGKFYLKTIGSSAIGGGCLDENSGREAIWYEAQCIVTNVALNFEPDSIITAQIQFITTDQFQLKSGITTSYLTQDDSGFYVLQEDGSKIEVEQLN